MAAFKEDESHVVTFVIRGPKKKDEVVKYMRALRRAMMRHKAKIEQKRVRHKARTRRKSKRRRPT